MDYVLRPAEEPEAAALADIIQRTFADVARRFGLTRENCPKHPSNCGTHLPFRVAFMAKEL